MGLIPCLIRTDNGKIERSNFALQMAGDVPFALEFAPRGDAHAKPVVEATFDLLNDLFGHQVVITTKGSPEARGVHDPDAAAIEHEIDAAKFERAFMQVLYDVYAHRWHGNLHERPAVVLKQRLAEFPVRTWQGTPDELRRLLRRDEGQRLVTRQGISYKGEMYGARWLKRYGLRRTVRIKVDEDDVRSLDVYDEDGVHLGEVRSDRIAARYDRPVSRWELDLERAADKVFAADAEAATQPRLHAIKKELTAGRADRKAARARHHRDRASETATASDVEGPDAAREDAARPVPPTLSLPVPDETTYEALLDPADAA